MPPPRAVHVLRRALLRSPRRIIAPRVAGYFRPGRHQPCIMRWPHDADVEESTQHDDVEWRLPAVSGTDPRIDHRVIPKTRRLRAEDLGFVEEMLVAACFPPSRALPRVDEARMFPHAARWLAPPVGVSDIAVVAEADGIGPIAAAVGRRFENAHPSWGVISPDVPELALAVASEHRGRRVGEALLRGWLEALQASGFAAA